MKKSLILAAVMSATLVTACAKKHDAPAAAPAKKQTPAKPAAALGAVDSLELKQFSNCEVIEPGTAEKKILSFNSGIVTMTTQKFSNPKCTGAGFGAEIANVLYYTVDLVSKDQKVLNLSVTKRDYKSSVESYEPSGSTTVQWEITREGENKIIVKQLVAVESIQPAPAPILIGEFSR